jgi:hypothetical protein
VTKKSLLAVTDLRKEEETIGLQPLSRTSTIPLDAPQNTDLSRASTLLPSAAQSIDLPPLNREETTASLALADGENIHDDLSVVAETCP